MAKEDPIARIEREQAAKAGKKGINFPLILAILLGIVLAVVIVRDVKLYNELTAEKEDLTQRIEELQGEYDNLSTDYAALNAQLDSSKEEVAMLIENIKKTEATNRKRIRQYEKELGTLRTIMRGYIVQIDSLNSVNRKLSADLATSQKALAQSNQRNQELGAKVETLSSQVAVGSVVKVRGINVIPQNASGKQTDRSSRVVDFLVNLTLSENDLATKGPKTVFVRVKDADGILLMDGTNASFKLAGETVAASAARTVDYEGKDVEVGIYVNPTVAFVKGMYTVDVYTEAGLAGSVEVLLR